MKKLFVKKVAMAIYCALPPKLRYFALYIINKRKIPNLFFPRDYSEYIFRDNFLGRLKCKSYLADKYLVREYVKERGLDNILTKLYGVWDDADKIDFSTLPSKFALKCNHSCGMNIICSDKKAINVKEVKRQINVWLHQKHPIFYESHYFMIKPMVICEEYLELDERGNFPMDYKIHCANGKPVFIQCCFERNSTSPGKRIIFDTEWNDLHYVIDSDSHASFDVIKKPSQLGYMLKCASILSRGLSYARIDLYEVMGKVYFGEITLTPMGGWLSYFKQEALSRMGDEIRKGYERKS